MLGGLRLAIAWHKPPSLVPSASIALIGYTRVKISESLANSYPIPAEWLVAEMRLTNEGRETICFAASGGEPYGWANVQTDEGPTNGYLAAPFTGGIGILQSGSSMIFTVHLPINTLRWQCGFKVATASLRDSIGFRLLSSSVCSDFPDLCFYPWQSLPDTNDPCIEVKSLMLQVTNAMPISP